ncbi:MAG: Prolyl-tRNA synthetase, archaeal/eukaryal type, partial [uncultured Corynebacteriales bacterium]
GTRAHPAGGGLPPLVSGHPGQGRAGRERPGPRDHGHPTVRVRALGADAGRGRRPDQGRRRQERVLPAVHPRVVPEEGSRARRGLQPGARRGDHRRRQGAGGAGRRPADQRDDHQRELRQVGAELPRPAAADQPVGQRGPLGDAAPAVPAHQRVPLAGGAHRARHLRRRPGVRAADPARRLPGLHGRRAGAAGHRRPQDRAGAVRRRDEHDDAGADDRRRQGPADGHLARARAEFRQGVRDRVPGAQLAARVRLADLVGHVHPDGRRADHGPRRRQRAAGAAPAGADPGRGGAGQGRGRRGGGGHRRQPARHRRAGGAGRPGGRAVRPARGGLGAQGRADPGRGRPAGPRRGQRHAGPPDPRHQDADRAGRGGRRGAGGAGGGPDRAVRGGRAQAGRPDLRRRDDRRRHRGRRRRRLGPDAVGRPGARGRGEAGRARGDRALPGPGGRVAAGHRRRARRDRVLRQGVL